MEPGFQCCNTFPVIALFRIVCERKWQQLFLLCIWSFKKYTEHSFIFLNYFDITVLKKFFFWNVKCCEIDMEKLAYLLCANAFIQETALSIKRCEHVVQKCRGSQLERLFKCHFPV